MREYIIQRVLAIFPVLAIVSIITFSLIHIVPGDPATILGGDQATESEAGLSFLGAGIPADTPSWGNIMGQARQYNQIAIWILFFPGLFLSLTVLGANLIGDGLRDTLDPRLRRLA